VSLEGGGEKKGGEGEAGVLPAWQGGWGRKRRARRELQRLEKENTEGEVVCVFVSPGPAVGKPKIGGGRGGRESLCMISGINKEGKKKEVECKCVVNSPCSGGGGGGGGGVGSEKPLDEGRKGGGKTRNFEGGEQEGHFNRQGIHQGKRLKASGGGEQ